LIELVPENRNMCMFMFGLIEKLVEDSLDLSSFNLDRSEDLSELMFLIVSLNRKNDLVFFRTLLIG
jgi:hypothetical protein